MHLAPWPICDNWSALRGIISSTTCLCNTLLLYRGVRLGTETAGTSTSHFSFHDRRWIFLLNSSMRREGPAAPFSSPSIVRGNLPPLQSSNPNVSLRWNTDGYAPACKERFRSREVTRFNPAVPLSPSLFHCVHVFLSGFLAWLFIKVTRK